MNFESNTEITDTRIHKICQILDANKAENITSFDLQDNDYIADFVVIATASIDRHLLALLDFLKKGLKPEEQFLYTDTSEEWVVIDLGDIIIHLMLEHPRAKYDLEGFLANLSKSEVEINS